MNRLGERTRSLWSKKRKRSHSSSDGTDEVLLPTAFVQTRSSRSSPRLLPWLCTHKLLVAFIVLIGIPTLLYLCLLALSTNGAFVPRAFQENRPRRLMLVVAHPDDECLFFAPALRVLHSQQHVELSLLVFSRGNHVGLGDVRARELLGSCHALNVPQERCVALDLPTIQDNPKVWWSEQQLIPIIRQYIVSWSIDFLISFDERGVSGHVNHRAVGSAVRLIRQEKNTTAITMAYELKSVSLPRKYASIVDFYLVFLSFTPRLLRSLLSSIVPFRWVSSPDRSRMLLINTPRDYMASRAAFASHQSQYSWDRHIYMLVSRYMFVSELQYIDERPTS